MTHLLPRITRIIARRPAPNFADGITTSHHLGKPDYPLVLQQHQNYMQALSDMGLQVQALPADERFPDGHFVEDPVVIFHDMAFLCRSGAPARQHEAETLIPHLASLRLVSAAPDARIDGGDVLICADRVLVGLSERTNAEGVASLRQALHSVQPDIRVDAVSFSGVLHLKTGLTELVGGVLLRDPALVTDYDLSWAEVISLPPAEGYAADVMPVNDTLFIAEGFPQALAVARRYYERVVPLPLSEFRKMDGGLTCLSLRY
jgi:dimethylargininase